MVRHAAHRRLVLAAFVPRGEHEVEQRRGALGVLEEHLVEVAEPVEEDRVGDLPLDLEVLLEHGGELHRIAGFRIVNSLPSRASNSTTTARSSAECGTASQSTIHRL